MIFKPVIASGVLDILRCCKAVNEETRLLPFEFRVLQIKCNYHPDEPTALPKMKMMHLVRDVCIRVNLHHRIKMWGKAFQDFIETSRETIRCSCSLVLELGPHNNSPSIFFQYGVTCSLLELLKSLSFFRLIALRIEHDDCSVSNRGNYSEHIAELQLLLFRLKLSLTLINVALGKVWLRRREDERGNHHWLEFHSLGSRPQESRGQSGHVKDAET